MTLRRPEEANTKLFSTLAQAHDLGFHDPLDLVFQKLLKGGNSWSTPKWELVHLLAHSQQIPVAQAVMMWEISHSFERFQQADPETFADVDPAAGVIIAFENPQLFLGEHTEELFKFGQNVYHLNSLDAHLHVVELAKRKKILADLPRYYQRLKQKIYREQGKQRGATYAIAADLIFGFVGTDSYVKKGGHYKSGPRVDFENLVKVAARELQACIDPEQQKALLLFRPAEREW